MDNDNNEFLDENIPQEPQQTPEIKEDDAFVTAPETTQEPEDTYEPKADADSLFGTTYHSSGAPDSSTYNGNYCPPQQNSYAPQEPPQAPHSNGNQPFTPYNFNTRTYNVNPEPQPQKSGNGKKVLLGIIIAIVVVAVALIGKTFLGNRSNNSGTSTTTAPAVTDANGSTVTDANGSVVTQTSAATVEYATSNASQHLSAVEIADKCRESVVGVMTYVQGTLSGEGSGIVMGFDAQKQYTYIMTCAHVISSSGVTYGVMKLDGSTYTAELVGYDSKTDIGVLKVKDTSFKVAEFGDSTALRIGETVYAIGNPGGSEYFASMTTGIISAMDRNVSGSYSLTCIQHDAAINPGNSGGALVNDRGQVIGVNSSKIAATDYEGMGFAVPTATAKSISESLIAYGYIPNRAALGITYAGVTDYQLYSMVVAIKGLPAGSIIITQINDTSAFTGTKVEAGDMITKVNGEELKTASVLLDKIENGNVGDELTLTICRVNSRTYQTTEFNVTIKLIEDKSSNKTEETTTTMPESSYDFGYGNRYDFGDFFSQFF